MWTISTAVTALLGAALWSLTSSSANLGIGPYDVHFQSVGRCPKNLNGKDSLYYTLKIQRLSRKSLWMHVNASFSIQLNDEQTLLANLAKHTNQGWKDNFFIMELPKACTTLFKNVPQLSSKLPKDLKDKPCPLPPGNYSIDIDLGIRPKNLLPQFSYGKYRARIFVRRSSETFFCSESIIDVVPKKSG